MMSLHLHNAHQQCLESPLQKFRTQICRKALIPISLESNKIYKILHQTPADSKSSRCQCISVCRYMFSESYLLPSIFSLITCIHLVPFKNFLATSASNGGLIEWKIALFHKKKNFWQINVRLAGGD